LLDNLEVAVGTTTRHSCDLRTAAYMIAIRRIEEALLLRGSYP
jgi:glutamate dehydrogenase (NAD(P)+)